jgi:Uma2 family endonuclease
MARNKGRRATYDDLKKVPDHLIAEIIDGELVTQPRPASPHARAGSAIGAGLFGPFDRNPGTADAPGGWWILDEPELHVHGDVLVPDLAGWRRERMPRLENRAAFELAPDWVCEIVSPGTARYDRTSKMDIYAREQVRHLWLVDPLARTLEIFALDGDRHWVRIETHGDPREPVRAVPFDAVALDLTRWWLPEDAPKAD